MTSLIGASGEDFATVLRSLGYRMERRAKPPEPAAPTVTAEAAASPAPDALGEVAVPSVESATPAEPQTAAEIVSAPAAVPSAEPAAEPASEPSAPPVEVQQAATAEATAAEAKPPEEPATIEVWRPGGRSERRPARHRRPPRQQATATAPAADAAAATPAEDSAPAAAAEAPSPQPERKNGPDREQRRERHARRERQERQERDNQRNAPRVDRGPRGPRRERGSQVERAEREQYYAKPFGGGGRQNKEPDPNSPFAKLAALKAQLEQKDGP
jgi:ATP-dependent RNA helicase SUPV3L1/SUV3